jgi:hypothetical protein
MTYDPRELPPTRRFEVPPDAVPVYPPSGPPMSPGPYGGYSATYGYGPALGPTVVVAPVVPASGAATASMVLGIIGALGGWCMLGVPCAIAILLGHVGLSATKDGSRSGRGMAVAGLVLGYLFVIPWAILFFVVFLGAVAGSTPAPRG